MPLCHFCGSLWQSIKLVYYTSHIEVIQPYVSDEKSDSQEKEEEILQGDALEYYVMFSYVTLISCLNSFSGDCHWWITEQKQQFSWHWLRTLYWSLCALSYIKKHHMDMSTRSKTWLPSEAVLCFEILIVGRKTCVLSESIDRLILYCWDLPLTTKSTAMEMLSTFVCTAHVYFPACFSWTFRIIISPAECCCHSTHAQPHTENSINNVEASRHCNSKTIQPLLPCGNQLKKAHAHWCVSWVINP